VGAVLLIGVPVALFHWAGVELCLFHRLTGWPCLTCGSTRALAFLATGDIAAAFRVQPLAALCAAGLGAAFAAYSVLLFLCRRVVAVRLGQGGRRATCAVGIALALLNWLYLVWRGV